MPDWPDIALLLGGAFAAGIVTGLTGFGTALTALALWLYAIPPVLAVPLVAFCSLSSHLFTLRKILPDVDGRAVIPYVLGAMIGIPVGVWLLTRMSPDLFKLMVGGVLIAYPMFVLAVKNPPSVSLNSRPVEVVIGVFSGICGGFAGLSGPVLVVWSQLCQWSKQRARSVLQIINMLIFVAVIATYALKGLVTAELFSLVMLCIPATLGGSWIGLRLYRVIDPDTFRKLVLMLLVVSGLGLLVPRIL